MRGSSISKQVVLSVHTTLTVPWCASTIERTMDSPSPTPCFSAATALSPR